jgi:hypothetical protein
MKQSSLQKRSIVSFIISDLSFLSLKQQVCVVYENKTSRYQHLDIFIVYDSPIQTLGVKCWLQTTKMKGSFLPYTHNTNNTNNTNNKYNNEKKKAKIQITCAGNFSHFVRTKSTLFFFIFVILFTFFRPRHSVKGRFDLHLPLSVQYS